MIKAQLIMSFKITSNRKVAVNGSQLEELTETEPGESSSPAELNEHVKRDCINGRKIYNIMA